MKLQNEQNRTETSREVTYGIYNRYPRTDEKRDETKRNETESKKKKERNTTIMQSNAGARDTHISMPEQQMANGERQLGVGVCPQLMYVRR